MNTRKFSNAQEKRVSKQGNGQKQPNSGATLFSKGDVKFDLFLGECKTAVKEQESFSIKKDWIDKLKEEAFAMNKPYWTVIFNFGGLRNNENFYIINERLFNQLQNFLKEENQ